MMANKKTSNGFTIIELLMSMSFLAFMLLFVITASTQVLRTYNKGLTIKDINQSSRTIIDQLARDVSSSTQPKIYKDALSGRLCTDGATYVWNTIQAPTPNPNKYKAPNANTGLHFIRTTDPTACGTKKTPDVPLNTATELLNGQSANVGSQASIIDLNLTPVNTKLYKLSLILGTSDPAGYTIVAAGTCGPGLQGEFCASASFNTTVYVPNGL
jgi:type II secretory pathway pseudopilin PulG